MSLTTMPDACRVEMLAISKSFGGVRARTGVGSPLVGVGIELDAIAAVVIGGASLNGGRGTAFNTLLGVLVLGLIGNVMNLLSVPAYPQQLIKGLIIIVAVVMQGISKSDD